MNDDDEWQLRYVRVPKGTHLSDSRASAGVERDLLREDGTNKLLGPTESVAADSASLYASSGDYAAGGSGAMEPSFGVQLVAEAVDALVAAIDWDAVFDRAAVAIGRTRGKIAKRLRSAIGRAEDRPGTDVAVEVADVSGVPPKAVLPATRAPEFKMSSAEYRGPS